MVHLWCAERGTAPPRPTDDADTVVDVRAAPHALATFTGFLEELGFTPRTSGDGLQHRWVRERGGARAVIDVMRPDGMGEVAAARQGAGGAPTLPTAGGTQALERSESVAVRVGSRTGRVRRPDLLGALVVKAAAHGRQPGGAGARHRQDFATLLLLLGRRDLRDARPTRKDRERLRPMLAAVRADRSVTTVVPEVLEAVSSLEDWLSPGTARTPPGRTSPGA